jgi:hypothetical protein
LWGRLRENLYLTASTVSLKGIVELDEVYVAEGQGFKAPWEGNIWRG